MVQFRGIRSIVVDSSGICVEAICGVDQADNGSLLQGVHHCVHPVRLLESCDVVEQVAVRHVAGAVRVAGVAGEEAGAVQSIGEAAGLVDLAGLVSDAVLEYVLVGHHWVAPVAAIVRLVAGQEHLRGDVDVRPLRLAQDLEAVGKRGGRREGPAGTAVFWDVLVAGNCQVVGAAHVTPEEGGRQVGEGLLGQRRGNTRLDGVVDYYSAHYCQRQEERAK